MKAIQLSGRTSGPLQARAVIAERKSFAPLESGSTYCSPSTSCRRTTSRPWGGTRRWHVAVLEPQAHWITSGRAALNFKRQSIGTAQRKTQRTAAQGSRHRSAAWLRAVRSSSSPSRIAPSALSSACASIGCTMSVAPDIRVLEATVDSQSVSRAELNPRGRRRRRRRAARPLGMPSAPAAGSQWRSSPRASARRGRPRGEVYSRS